MPDRPALPQSRRHPCRRSVAGLVAAVALLAACSSSSPDGPSPEEAARTLTAGFALDQGTEQCFRERFEQDEGATTALAVGGGASSGERGALQAVLVACITPEQFGDVVAESVGSAIAGTGTEQQQCLRTATVALPPERRSLLMVGLALSGDGTPDELDADLGEVTSELFGTCSVRLSETDAAGGDTTTSVPAPSAPTDGP
jgi:hypothetical protein